MPEKYKIKRDKRHEKETCTDKIKQEKTFEEKLSTLLRLFFRLLYLDILQNLFLENNKIFIAINVISCVVYAKNCLVCHYYY